MVCKFQFRLGFSGRRILLSMADTTQQKMFQFRLGFSGRRILRTSAQSIGIVFQFRLGFSGRRIRSTQIVRAKIFPFQFRLGFSGRRIEDTVPRETQEHCVSIPSWIFWSSHLLHVTPHTESEISFNSVLDFLVVASGQYDRGSSTGPKFQFRLGFSGRRIESKLPISSPSTSFQFRLGFSGRRIKPCRFLQHHPPTVSIPSWIFWSSHR